mgnify:FL=1|tara:strand:- start:454 stop:663 length:210 start_codon:yes stop_codon:yes gene_type:complete
MIITISIITLLVYLAIASYRLHAKEQNNIIINMENYEKKKVKQQESKILGQKSTKREKNKKEKTRMYHI